jgi:hypothetical protein
MAYRGSLDPYLAGDNRAFVRIVLSAFLNAAMAPKGN